MDDVTVAGATPEDLSELVQLFMGYPEFYGRRQDASSVERFLRDRVANGDSVILTANIGGRLVGFTQCYPTRSSLALAPAWVLNDLFVSQEGRGSGAGRALVRAAADAARDADAVYIALETAPDNATAQALYESEGYELDDEFLHFSLGLTGA
ncbi:GNAT family N-acetyltransferase [Nocardioides sp. B-3]|uniref:GNAT family N-acetyltransferase n=1 Tax=Nocardioides sp. B-3 TaxID=2895565 RepID=UPI0021524DC8|nr:GNAT family N-acetyltransferase [Nocardioides sp. B-3]UUZ58701.1 GNAT family N-acetyltransferase [Nocardioides sp. B-3]